MRMDAPRADEMREFKLVSDLREEIVDVLRGQDTDTQIKAAFSALVTVLLESSYKDVRQTKRALMDLKLLMAKVE